jgi:phospholipid/cholesterol/gamma-HCH transport system substrate-binding protein
VSRRTEIQVGVTVLVALAVTLWGVTWLKELTLARKVRTWHVAFPQTGGLATSDEVQVNGLRKGSVASLQLVDHRVIVDLQLASDIVITDRSVVAVRNVGLMGEKVVAVDLVEGGAPYTDRDTIPGVYEKGVPEVMAEVGGTIDALNALAVQLAQVAAIMERNGNLDRTLTNFRDTSEELRLAVSENRAVLKATLGDLRATAGATRRLTADREAQLARTIDSFERSVASLERLTTRLDSLRAVAQSVTEKVDRGEGSLGRLVNDPKLYEDARTTVTELKTLIADIKKNPKKYLDLSIF